MDKNINLKKDYQLEEEIAKSIKKECLLCGKKDCIKSHSISKRKYLLPISEGSHVYGSFRASGIQKLSRIGINEASTFYNFCDDCDKFFAAIDKYNFDESNDEQIFLLYYRALAAQIHQIKEELIFFEKNKSIPTVINHIKNHQLALDTYINKIKTFSESLKQRSFKGFNCKIIEFNRSIAFVYYNILNILYDLNSVPITRGNEIVINIFCENGTTKVLFIWEKVNDIYLSNYIKQLTNMTETELQFYLTNIIIAFPFNFYINPRVYLNWNQKDNFEKEKIQCSDKLLKYNNILFNFFLKQKNVNLFDTNELI